MSAAHYEYFRHDGFNLAFCQAGAEKGEPVLLIHGFAASVKVNWPSLPWFDELLRAGHHVIAFDHRGHGQSTKSHRIEDYAPEKMAADGIALLDHLGIKKAHILGYSMGGRLAVYTAAQAPHRVQSAVFGGTGLLMLCAPLDWGLVRAGLLAESADEITDEHALLVRNFAEQNPNDLRALAACAVNMGKAMTEEQLRRITMPALVAVGADDVDLIGSPEALLRFLPRGEVLRVPGCSHMTAPGSAAYRRGIMEFIAKHPMGEG